MQAMSQDIQNKRGNAANQKTTRIIRKREIDSATSEVAQTCEFRVQNSRIFYSDMRNYHPNDAK